MNFMFAVLNGTITFDVDVLFFTTNGSATSMSISMKLDFSVSLNMHNACFVIQRGLGCVYSVVNAGLLYIKLQAQLSDNHHISYTYLLFLQLRKFRR